MSTLLFQDLPASAVLDEEAMSAIRGGLNAVVNNSQQANQAVAGGYGSIFAINAPVSAPVTNLVESNPVTIVEMDIANLIGSHQNQLIR